jgi:glycosyltransferase involved in cell wall biosynthesis
MKNKPLLTIVTVCLNSEKYLEETIKSVINQSYINIEYIIIDGGSTDKTLDIIKKYEKYIDKWISEPDNGIYDAMNKGIDMANGEMINFLNSNDYYYSKKSVKNIVEKYIKTKADVISGKLELINKNGEHLRIISKKNFSKMKIEEFSISHPSTFVKTEIMKKYKFDTNYKIGADYKLLQTLFIKKYLFVNLDCIVTSFREGGISSNKELRIKEKIKIDIELLGITRAIKKNYNTLFRFFRNRVLVKLLGKDRYIKVKNKLLKYDQR